MRRPRALEAPIEREAQAERVAVEPARRLEIVARHHHVIERVDAWPRPAPSAPRAAGRPRARDARSRTRAGRASPPSAGTCCASGAPLRSSPRVPSPSAGSLASIPRARSRAASAAGVVGREGERRQALPSLASCSLSARASGPRSPERAARRSCSRAGRARSRCRRRDGRPARRARGRAGARSPAPRRRDRAPRSRRDRWRCSIAASMPRARDRADFAPGELSDPPRATPGGSPETLFHESGTRHSQSVPRPDLEPAD